MTQYFLFIKLTKWRTSLKMHMHAFCKDFYKNVCLLVSFVVYMHHKVTVLRMISCDVILSYKSCHVLD